jgi:UDP:flavonoid glycosyltransferase YjiC (YdhE family)
VTPGSAQRDASADPADLRIAAFVSPHGFGHAARSSAVMAEIRRQSGATFEIFTMAPEWFFQESLGGSFRYHPVAVDVGFRQRSALEIDLAATLSALQSHVPFDAKIVRELATSVQATGCRAVLCDIAPLGIAVAEEAGLPSVLVENFTWPWLYRPHFGEAPGLEALAAELAGWSDRATVRVQATPVCERRSEYELVRPISRPPRMLRGAVRSALGVESDTPMVVVTMGGYGEDLPFLDRLRALPDTTFLITGVPRTGRDGNLRLFDNDTPLFMPDVLRAADAVIAKLGYGTVAEVWSAGLPFGHVTRPDSREMASLEDFAAEELAGFLLTGDEFAEGTWIARLPDLLAMTRRPHEGGGAGRAAEVLLELVGLDAR